MRRFIARHFDGFSSGGFFFIAALALDRAAKSWALSHLGRHRGDGAFFSLGLFFNRGIAFSLLKNHPYLSFAAPLAAMGLLGLLWAKSETARSTPGMAFLWAGAAGNLIDRLLYGYVVDWIYIFGVCVNICVNFYVNLADIWLGVGGLLLMVHCAGKLGRVGSEPGKK